MTFWLLSALALIVLGIISVLVHLAHYIKENGGFTLFEVGLALMALGVVVLLVIRAVYA